MASSNLKCMICPKNPSFSDISHLLTHVSSKGHLAHRFKLQVRSQQEPDVEQLLTNYDRWFKEQGLGKLLSERMHLKDSKSTSSRTRIRKSHTTRAPTSSVSLSVEQGQLNDITENHCVLDPRLSQTVLLSNREQAQPAHARAWLPTFAENNQGFTSGPHPTYHLSDKADPNGEPASRSHGHSVYPNPLTIATPVESVIHKDSHPHSSRSLPKSIDTTHKGSAERNIVETEDATKLKGVMWPGMDLFDSASEEMKRKRNQKKDGSILEQMEITSASVDPEEIIYSPSGQVKKRRPITGMVEISSPLQGETPLVKRKAPKTKQSVLRELDVNGLIGTRSRMRKLGVSYDSSAQNLRDLSKKTLSYLPNPSMNQQRNGLSALQLTEDYEAEFRLTIGGFNEKKRSFKIFEEIGEDGQCNNHSLAGRTSAQPSHREENHGQGRIGQQRTLDHSNSHYNELARGQPVHYVAVPSNGILDRSVGQATRLGPTGEGRGNAGLRIPQAGRLRPSSMIGERVHQRYFAVQEGRPPQFYSAAIPQMAFSDLIGSANFADAVNPLAYTFQGVVDRPELSQTPIRDGHIANRMIYESKAGRAPPQDHSSEYPACEARPMKRKS